MAALLSSLSLASASVFVAVVSVLAALVYGRLKRAIIRWLAALMFPLALSYAIYWAPVWLGAPDVAQYHAWEPVGVGVPFLAGAVFSTVATVLVSRHANARSTTAGLMP